MLKKGDRGVSIVNCKKNLNLLGYSLDADSNIFDDEMQLVVMDFQRRHSLAPDGIIGPITIGVITQALISEITTKEPKVTSFSRAKLAQVAEAVGRAKLKWTGPGCEADKFKSKFFSVFGKGKWSWCAATVTYECEQAGLPMPIMCPSKFGYTFALCEGWQQWAQEKGFYFDNDGAFSPESGDIVLFDWDQISINDRDADWENHIGVFLRMSGKSFVTAEGNTSNQTDVKTRTAKQIQGFIRIPDGYSFGVVAK